MAAYSLRSESARILHDRLLDGGKIDFPESFKEAAQHIRFVGGDDSPFVPTPLKMTESSSALNALVAVAASAVAKDRYGVDYQDIEVNTDVATLFLMSLILPTVNGQSVLQHPQIVAECQKGDLYQMRKPIHRQCTNIYKTKDGRWFHLHGSMNAAHTMQMLGVSEQDVTDEEAFMIYAEKVAQWNAEDIDKAANEQHRQAGVVCNTPEEFFASEHGRAMVQEPLYRLKPHIAPRKPWPPTKNTSRPLEGIRVIDFSRVIAAPVVSKILAVLGAEVIKVTSNALPDITSTWVDLSTGKRDVNLDLKSQEGLAIFESLIKSSDILIDGYRPGVLKRLGFDHDALRKVNTSLIYFRENCYGFKGPFADRSGWQQISDCLTGIAWLQGKFLGLDEPVVPLLPNSDYQMGLAGATAVIHALFLRTKGDMSFDIDISLTQYNIWYYGLGAYTPEQQKALRARNSELHLRHYDEMSRLIMKTRAAIQKCRPDIFEHPEYFQKMSGLEWGIKDDILILIPPFKLAKSVLVYDVPSGCRGRSRPEWDSRG
ncbi:hypothetical protein BDV12DRAFT_190333 [Aspergillus spectabilis]